MNSSVTTKRKFSRRGISVDYVEYDYLRGRLDVEAVLEDLGIDIAFRPRPNQIMCHCPDLHGNHSNGDSSPSFGVNEDMLAYNCFVCGGGNIIQLVQMMRPEYAHRFEPDPEKDREALAYLEKFADFNITSSLVDRVNAILHPQEEQEEPMPDYPVDSLFQYRKIHPYLYERGLTKDVIVDMQVGFDDEHCGIIIPHFFMGKLVGMQWRHLAQTEDGRYLCPTCNDPKKYKNTTHFPKKNTLYGYDRLKRVLQTSEGKSVIVVESPMTALKLMSMGFDRVVATFGQFSVEQGMLLIACPLIYFWPDNDGAGYENTERAIDALGQYTSLKIVPVLPNLKGDAADLDDNKIVSQYLQNAYSSTLFRAYAQDRKLPTLEQLLSSSEH